MRGSPVTISDRGVHSFHRYLVRTMAEDRGLDQFARELLTGLGNTLNHPAANFYRVSRTPEEAGEAFAQLFLGVRIQCAKCHNHPFESLTQTDYYGLAAFFAQVQFKGSKFGLDDEVVYLQPGREVQHPATHKKQDQSRSRWERPTAPLAPDDDRRQRFADWLTGPGQQVLRSGRRPIASGIHLMGRGIVEPVDDVRATAIPPSSPELLESFLAADFVKHGYRLKPLIRLILNSKTYQLSSAAAPKQSPFAADGDRYFTKYIRRRSTCCRRRRSSTRFRRRPACRSRSRPTRSAPARSTLPKEGVNHPFLQAFSKPVRDVSCECARDDDPSLPQMLQLLNNASLLEKIRSPRGRIATLLALEGERRGDHRGDVPGHALAAADAGRDGHRAPTCAGKRRPRARFPRSAVRALMNLGEFLLRH